MKFLCLNLWQGKVCTDDDDDANDTNDHDAQWTKHDCLGSLVDKPNAPKKKIGFHFFFVQLI